jgi:hypothetical protein
MFLYIYQYTAKKLPGISEKVRSERGATPYGGTNSKKIEFMPKTKRTLSNKMNNTERVKRRSVF